jgi:hypothetical protein
LTTLFDDIERTHDGPARYSDASFPHWNRSARKDITAARLHLEHWFSRYPSAHAANLRHRFRDKNDVLHRGAFFELFLHEMLLRLSCTVEVEPEVPGTPNRPDFRVTPPDRAQFYLEATVSTGESKEAAAARARTECVYDAINEIDSPDFWINVEVRGTPVSPVPRNKLMKFLAENLTSADYDDITHRYEQSGFDDLPCWHYEFEGWGVDFFLIPKRNARGRKGVRPMGMQKSSVHNQPLSADLSLDIAKEFVVDSVTPVRNAILAKAGRYGTPDLPYVVAINALDDDVDEIDVVAALFGDEPIVSRFEGDPFQERRKPNGVFAKYTRVSAVLVFMKLYGWNFSSVDARLYHNPRAAKEFSGALMRVAQEVVVNGRLNLTSGSSLPYIFGVHPDLLGG